MNWPKLSILTPTYNRRKFLPVMIHNVSNFDYPKEKLEWCILDDGTEKLFTPSELKEVQQQLHPIRVKYRTLETKKAIGHKRNAVVKQASYKTVIMMDDDDIYFPEYLKTSIQHLQEGNFGLVGSKDMILTFPLNEFHIAKFTGGSKRQVHEATMCFTKKYFKSMGGFNRTGTHGEGTKMIDHNEKSIGLTNIENCMMCVVHTENTYNKDRFRTDVSYKHTLSEKNIHSLKLYEPILKKIL